MTSSNHQQNQIDEEALVQEIINENAVNVFWWLIFTTVIIEVIHIIFGLLSISILSFTKNQSSINFYHRLTALVMFIHPFNLFCILLYANHRILEDFKTRNIADVATINYKLIHRSILFFIAAGMALFSLFSILDFMNPPF